MNTDSLVLVYIHAIENMGSDWYWTNIAIKNWMLEWQSKVTSINPREQSTEKYVPILTDIRYIHMIPTANVSAVLGYFGGYSHFGSVMAKPSTVPVSLHLSR